jgi:hypothetical protein
MDFTKTFYVQEGFKRGAARAKQSHDVVGERDIALAIGEWAPSEPLKLVQYEGTKWLDFVGTQTAALRLVSTRLLDRFTAAGVTGWRALPVALVDRSGAAVADYKLLVVTGRCGGIDNARSVLTERVIVGTSRGAKVWKGLYFDEGTWDGHDLFSPRSTAFIFATAKVKAILESEAATNFDLVALADVERPSLI